MRPVKIQTILFALDGDELLNESEVPEVDQVTRDMFPKGKQGFRDYYELRQRVAQTHVDHYLRFIVPVIEKIKHRRPTVFVVFESKMNQYAEEE